MTHIENWYWEDFEIVSSTNDTAREFINKNKTKFIVTSKKQTTGRGRRGRSWVGIDGNLFMSFCLDMDAKYIGVLSFIVSLCIFDVVKTYSKSADVKLKWPNDILINDKKISGILIEREQDNFIVGIGVNIADYPKNVASLYEATSLKENNIITDRIEFMKRYIMKLNHYLLEFEENGFDKIRKKWLKNTKNLNEKIKISNETSETEGIFSGVDENGFLLLNTGDRIQKIYVGDVFYL